MPITKIEQVSKMGGMYGQTTKQLQAQAIMHWKEWRPKEAAALEAAGLLQAEALKAAERTQEGIRSLMQAGYQHHEAEEVMLPRYILLPPEKEVVEEMERE